MKYLSQQKGKKETILIVDKTELQSDANNILEIIKNNFNNNHPTFICVVRTLDSTIDSSSNYLYSNKELSVLSEIEHFYLSKGYKDAIKFSELNEINNEDDYNSAWPFSMVVKANRQIDKIVDSMHKLKLTPFEAMLYVHMYVASFRYNETKNITKWEKELSRVLLGMATDEKFIVCSGYASFGKAILDKYNDKNIFCDFSPIQLMEKNDLLISAHEQLVVTINDEKYKISGIYGDDICLNTYEDEIADISACLFPLEDINEFKNYTTRIMNFKNRYEEIITPAFDDKISNDDVNNFLEVNKNKNSQLVVRTIKGLFERRIDKNAIKSEPIPYDTYFNALFTLLYKSYCLEQNIPFDKTFDLSSVINDIPITDCTIDSFNKNCYDIIRKSIISSQSLFDMLRSKNTFCLAPYYEKDPMIEDLKSI